jgi:Sec-independent protein translocase protein TatA
VTCDWPTRVLLVSSVSLQELLIIVLLLLVVFGPGKAVGTARDLGRFANTARDQVEELVLELLDDTDGDYHDGSKS